MKKRIRNLFVGALGAVITVLPVAARDTTPALILERTDGTSATLLLSDSPVLTISDDALTARSTKEEVTIELAGLADFHFVEVQAGVKDVELEGNVDFANGKIVFSGLRKGARVNVYAIDGRILDNLTAAGDEPLEVDFSRYERGILIISCGKSSYKVNNR